MPELVFHHDWENILETIISYMDDNYICHPENKLKKNGNPKAPTLLIEKNCEGRIT